jgi:hypothetical protein
MNERFDRLPPAMKDALQGLHDLHGTPENMNLQVLLGVANLAAAKRFKVDTDDGFEGGYGVRPIHEYFLGIAPTGAQKTTVFRDTTPGIIDYQDKMQKDLGTEEIRYALHLKKFNNEKNEYLKKLEDDPMAPVPKAPIPAETADYLITKGTLNGITKPLKSQAFLGLFSSEAGEFFAGHSFQGGKDISKAVEMSASLTSIWDGANIEKNTGEESFKLKNRCVSMLFLLQEKTIQHILNNPMYSEQGFIHRILITQSPRFEKPLWELTEESKKRKKLARSKLLAFNNRIASMMDEGVKTLPGRPFEIDYEIMQQSPDAVTVMVDWYNANRLRDTGDMANYAGFIQRIHEHCMRLAATVAAFDGSTVIQQRHALCAIDLMDFYIQERINLEVGVMVRDQERSQSAVKVLAWIKAKNWTNTKNDLRKNGPGFFREMDTSQRDQILEDLLRDEELIMTETTVNGKVKQIFSLNTGESSK